VTRCVLDKFPELIRQLTVEKWSPLHACCINGHSSIFEMILKHQFPKALVRTFK